MVGLLKVKVTPIRSIPGILGKNKNINAEMVLELNKREIMHCMRFGVVHDMNGTLVDDKYLNTYFDIRKALKQPLIKNTEVSVLSVNKFISDTIVTEDVQTKTEYNSIPVVSIPVTVSDNTIAEEIADSNTPEYVVISKHDEPDTDVSYIATLSKELEEPNESISTSTTVEESTELPTLKGYIPVEEYVEDTSTDTNVDIKEVYHLNMVSCEKDGNYIVLTTQFINEYCDKIGGNLYGLFTIISGSRPSVLEYFNDGVWMKFNNKFRNFDIFENEQKFIFRFIPKNNAKFRFKLSLKNSNDVLVSLSDEINPNEI